MSLPARYVKVKRVTRSPLALFILLRKLAAFSSLLGAAACLIVPVAAQQADQLSTPQPPAKLFDLQGQVLLRETTEPLRGVTVRLDRHTETTDADGRFAFRGIPEGTYSLRLELDGHILVGYPPGMGISLSEGTKIPYLTLKMSKSSGVGGLVEDEDHHPLSRIQVSLLEKLIVAGSPILRPYKEITTDDKGEFSIEAPPGEYFLYAAPVSPTENAGKKALPPRGTPQFIGTFYQSSPDLEGAVPVTLYPAAPLLGLRLQLQKASLYNVTGRIEGAESHTDDLTKLAIELRKAPRSESSLPVFGAKMPGEAPLASKVRQDGTFSIEGLPPGSYLATVGLEGATVGKARVTVTDRDVEKLQVIASPVVTFAGRIVQEKQEYRGEILLGLQGLDADGFRAFRAPVSESGEFAIQGITPGTYIAKLDADRPLFVTSVEFPGKSSDGAKFDLTAAGSDRVVMRVSSEGATIAGRVDGNFRPGSPARGIVSLVITPTTFLEMNSMAPVPLEADGSFSAQPLQPGRYRACAWREEGNEFVRILSNPHFQIRLDRACKTVEVKAGERQFVTLDQLSVSDFAQ